MKDEKDKATPEERALIEGLTEKPNHKVVKETHSKTTSKAKITDPKDNKETIDNEKHKKPTVVKKQVTAVSKKAKEAEDIASKIQQKPEASTQKVVTKNNYKTEDKKILAKKELTHKNFTTTKKKQDDTTKVKEKSVYKSNEKHVKESEENIKKEAEQIKGKLLKL